MKDYVDDIPMFHRSTIRRVMSSDLPKNDPLFLGPQYLADRCPILSEAKQRIHFVAPQKPSVPKAKMGNLANSVGKQTAVPVDVVAKNVEAPDEAKKPLADKASVKPALEEPTAKVNQPEVEAKPKVEAKVEPKVEPEITPEAKPETKADSGGKKFGSLGSTAIIDADTGPIKKSDADKVATGGGGGNKFHKRLGSEDYGRSLKLGIASVRRNLIMVMFLTCATNILILAIPIYLFQISDRVLTSRSVDTLIMLTIVIVGAVIMQAVFDAIRRFILMRTAVEVAVQLGAPVLSAASHASLHGTGREYQTLGDLQQLRGFLTSGTLISFLDVPFAPLFIFAIFLVHPHLGAIVCVASLVLMIIAIVNQKVTASPFAKANMAQAKANQHLDSMARNSQIINALAMIPEAVMIWGRDTAASLSEQVRAQDRNIMSAAVSRVVRLLTQVAMLGWGAFLAIDGQITGGMVIAASIIAGRALAPVEGAIEGWNGYLLSKAAYGRIATLLNGSKMKFEKLHLPRPEGRLDVERLLYVPGGTKQVVLNGISFSLNPGESLAVIGNSGAGKTTLGRMLVGSILPTSGNVRLDLMDLRNWDPRQFGESIGYLPQDVQLFPGTIKQNIARMRPEATDAQIHEAATLADVHEMIASLPQGYETMVAADGSPLSGGQKQRIALARAFFGNPKFVVLDEPNSNLDTHGDKALARAINHARTNKITVVVITQKPSLLSVVDKIMLVADGSVAMFGERTEVLTKLAGNKAKPVAQTQKEGLPNAT
jgi:ATP-binding cassette subfamily C protein